MKIYNPNTFQKLGFDIIIKETAKRAISEDAKAACLEMLPYSDTEMLIDRLEKVREMKDLLDFDDPFPFNQFSSVGFILQKTSVKGNWLSLEELARLYKWLTVVKQVRAYLSKRKEKYPKIASLAGDAGFTESVLKDVEKILDPYGNMRDDASPELSSIRKNIKNIGIELRTLLNRILRHANDNNWSVEKEITMRNDRLVIPVKADSKGRIPGFIQDISQSGQTVFIEPTESLVFNNRLREYQILEQNEIVKILIQITDTIRGEVASLLYFKEVITEIDILRAKAMMAKTLKASLPNIQPLSNTLQIINGYYPVLQLRAEQQPFDIIPLQVEMNKKQRIVIISGPNAGGKSVSLKTVGLLQLMLQSGFLIPVDERSVFCLFDSLFIDLGDEQSVENDLSTYTSHLFRMREMGDNMNENALFLIDEFGGGTDPKLGGAIAESFLERFIRQGAFGIITTHYGNLKEYAQTHSGVANAAMEFDTVELKPTYRLLMGIPGRSYAFEIAERVGVHRTIVRNAKNKIGQEVVFTEKLIEELERKNTELNKLVESNAKQSVLFAEKLKKYETLEKELKLNKAKIIADAKLEAKRIIENSNQKIEQTIREIKENKAEKEQTKLLRKKLEEAIPEITELAGMEEAKVTEGNLTLLPTEKPIVGDWVKLKNAESYGKLLEINGKKGTVEIGAVRTTIALNQLVKIVPPIDENAKHKSVNVLKMNSVKSTSPEIDVMGMRVEEALPLIDKKIDDAVWAGLKFVGILHGKGTGTLREAIRKHLKDLNVIKSLSDAPLDMGGEGWTMVTFW